MAPEQAEGKVGAIDERTDVYAIGATLYTCLTGSPPFVRNSLSQILDAVLNDDPVAPRKLNRTVSRDLETICLKCMEKERNNLNPEELQQLDLRVKQGNLEQLKKELGK